MERLEMKGSECFEEFFSLLEKSFPTDEYREREGQLALFSREEYRLLCCCKENELSAFFSLWEFGDFCFLEHFAVDPKLRGQGLGTKLLEDLAAYTEKPIILEVEMPDTEQAKRRIGFYRRNGFFTNEYPYAQPAYSKDKKALPMILMSKGRTVNRMELEKIKGKVYSAVYGID